jgi:hypothetical protein
MTSIGPYGQRDRWRRGGPYAPASAAPLLDRVPVRIERFESLARPLGLLVVALTIATRRAAMSHGSRLTIKKLTIWYRYQRYVRSACRQVSVCKHCDRDRHPCPAGLPVPVLRASQWG